MHNNDHNLQAAALSALGVVKSALFLALAWFLVIAVVTGLVLLVARANLVFTLLALLSAIAVLFSIVLGVRLLHDGLCRGAAGVWSLATDTPQFRLQLLWLLLSGFLFAFTLMAL